MLSSVRRTLRIAATCQINKVQDECELKLHFKLNFYGELAVERQYKHELLGVSFCNSCFECANERGAIESVDK